MQYLIYNNEKEAQNALDVINISFGFPDNNGTDTWDTLKKAYKQDIWYFVCPNGMQASNTKIDISKFLAPLKENILP